MRGLFLSLMVVLASCGGGTAPPAAESRITVAAAANLTGVFDEVARAFQNKTGVEVVLSYGSTASLAQQVEHGAPFDVYAAADTEHVDQLVKAGKLYPDSRAIYARGALAMWAPGGEKSGIRDIKDLAGPQVRFIAIAKPELAPYGKAAVEALKAAGLWDRVEAKIVYAADIRMAKQYAATGNADAAFTAYSLVMKEAGAVVQVDPRLHAPIDQTLGIVTASQKPSLAKQFTDFLQGAQGRRILEKGGYLLP